MGRRIKTLVTGEGILMLRNADYIYNNILRADEINSTLKYCKKAQVGVDLSVRNFRKLSTPGIILRAKSIVSETDLIEKNVFTGVYEKAFRGWYLVPGTYILELNEGCWFGPRDTGLVVLRSSFNRSGCTIVSAVWDPGYTSVSGDIINTMSVRFNVDGDYGIYIEENARVAQLIVFENEDTSLYNGQFQGGLTSSKLV